MSFISSFFGGLARDVSKRWIFTRQNMDVVKGYFFKKAKYFQQLEVLLKEMPFIYKDFDSEVIADFQHIEAIRLRSNNLDIEVITGSEKVMDTRIIDDWFKADRKILVIGDAGVGKSTLMRYLVLSIVRGKQIPYLNYLRGSIPIFIHLKMIIGNVKSPILSYILDEVPLYEGPRGQKLLERHIRQRKVIFFLDGYDEISFVGGEDYLKHELAMFFSNYLSSEKIHRNKINTKYYELYKHITDAKVILTSREEFYRLHILENLNANIAGVFAAYSMVSSFKAIKLTGLGNMRYNFVKLIFDKQKANASLFRDHLEAELFVSEIDSAEDAELKKFSRTPLFLTIMIYLYITLIREGKSTKKLWETTAEKLIEECVLTLLKDIDSYKVRALTDAQKLGFEKRRNSYFDEKIKFLEYFAHSLISEKKGVFTFAYLRDKVIVFFRELFKNENSQKIISSHEIGNSVNPSFSEQLLFSGVFTTVCRIDKELNYDFPHRRFREILAKKYINSESGSVSWEQILSNEHATEFTIYYFRQSDNSVKERLINVVLESCSGTDFGRQNGLLAESLEEGDRRLFTNVFYSKIKEWITTNKRVRISRKLINKLIVDDFIKDSLTNQMNNLDDKNYNSWSLIFSLMLEFSGLSFKFFLEKNMHLIPENYILKLLKLKYEYYGFEKHEFSRLFSDFKVDQSVTNKMQHFFDFNPRLSKIRQLGWLEQIGFIASIPSNKYNFPEYLFKKRLELKNSSKPRILVEYVVYKFLNSVRSSQMVKMNLIPSGVCDFVDSYFPELPILKSYLLRIKVEFMQTNNFSKLKSQKVGKAASRQKKLDVISDYVWLPNLDFLNLQKNLGAITDEELNSLADIVID